MTSVRRLALTLAAAAFGGWLASMIGIPLPWVLGAMFGVSIVGLAGAQSQVFLQPAWARRGAQLLIGCALGLYFTPAVILQVSGLAAWMMCGALLAMLLSVVCAKLLQRLARVDGPTAIYSVVIGASSEMALQAIRAGADGALVASAHAVRIILVTCTVSLVAWSTGAPSAVQYVDAPVVSVLAGSILLTSSAGAAWLVRRLRMPNPWLLGPLIVCAAAAALGLDARLPDGLMIVSQVVIGWALGQSISRDFFRRAPRVLASAACLTLCMIVVCASFAAVVAGVTGLPLLTGFVGLAPGGMAEMAVIAKAFGLGAPVVLGFHLIRVFATIFLTRHLAAWMLRSGWIRH